MQPEHRIVPGLRRHPSGPLLSAGPELAASDAYASQDQSEKLIVQPPAARPLFPHGLPTNSATDPTIQVWLDDYRDGGTAQLLERAAKSLYYWLGKVGGALRVPRPCPVQQNPAAVAAVRAGLEQNLEKLNLPKDRAVKIGVADEARFGWHTHRRRCWALRGQRVVRAQEQRDEGEYVYGAVEVVAGLAEFRFLPSASRELRCGLLQQLADRDAHAEHVVIWDQAGFHPRPGEAALPARIHLLPLPPYSPEPNPVEGLWDQTQDVTCHRHFAGLDQLEAALTQALRPFWETPARALSLVHHWLHSQANATA